MNATAINNKPIETLRERGGLKSTIWKNSSAKGNFYSIEISRTYKDDQGYHDSRSFNESDLLLIAHLSAKTLDRISELRAKDASEPSAVE